MGRVGIVEKIRQSSLELNDDDKVLIYNYLSAVIQNVWNLLEKESLTKTKPLNNNSSLNISNNLPDISKLSPIPRAIIPNQYTPKSRPRGPRNSSPLNQARRAGGNVWPRQTGGASEGVSLSEFIITKKPKKNKRLPLKTTAMRAMSFADSPPKAASTVRSNTFDVAEILSTEQTVDERALLKQIRQTQEEILKRPPDPTGDTVCSCANCFGSPLHLSSVTISPDPDGVIYSTVRIFMEQVKTSFKFDFLSTFQNALSLFVQKDNQQLKSIELDDVEGIIVNIEDLFCLVLNVIIELPEMLLAAFTPCTVRALSKKLSLVETSSMDTQTRLCKFQQILTDLSSLTLSGKYTFRHVLKPSTVDQHQLQKKENFLSTESFAALRKQRDELFHIFRVWRKNHADPEWNFDLHVGSRIRCLVHAVNVSGNTTSFSRLFLLILLDAFIDQQTEIVPSQDCSLESSQLDLFNLISHFDVMTIVKEGNVRKLAALEQRFHQPKPPSKASEQQLPEDGSFFTGVQSFFQSFLVISGCARLHCLLLDLTFDSLSAMMDQIHRLDFDDTDCLLRSAIYETRVAHLIAKFCGFLYFLPYRDSQAHESLSCRPHRSSTIDFFRLLQSESDTRKLLLLLNITSGFMSQNQSNPAAVLAHLEEFGDLKNWCHLIATTVIPNSLFASAIRHNSSVVIQALPIRVNKLPYKSALNLQIPDDLFLAYPEFIILCPELLRVNRPRSGSSTVTKIEKRRRVETTIVEANIDDAKSSKTAIEDAFYKSHPNSLKRAVEFVVERVTSNCVKHFRTRVIPDIIRDANVMVKAHFNTSPTDAEDDVIALALMNATVDGCIAKSLDRCLEDSVSFCDKNCGDALPPLLGPDVAQEAVTFATKLASRDTREKTSAWFREKIPIIVNRDGRGAFERSRTNRVIHIPREITNDAYIPHFEVLTNLREVILRHQLGGEHSNDVLKLLPELFSAVPSMDGGSIKTASFLVSQILFICLRMSTFDFANITKLFIPEVTNKMNLGPENVLMCALLEQLTFEVNPTWETNLKSLINFMMWKQSDVASVIDTLPAEMAAFIQKCLH